MWFLLILILSSVGCAADIEVLRARQEAEQARQRFLNNPGPPPIWLGSALPSVPPYPIDQNWMIRTPQGDLYWKTGSTIWGPHGPYTIY